MKICVLLLVLALFTSCVEVQKPVNPKSLTIESSKKDSSQNKKTSSKEVCQAGTPDIYLQADSLTFSNNQEFQFKVMAKNNNSSVCDEVAYYKHEVKLDSNIFNFHYDYHPPQNIASGETFELAHIIASPKNGIAPAGSYSISVELGDTLFDQRYNQFLNFNLQEDELPAFPSAFGAGAYATGGRGGQVIHVTSLADQGPGTLRDALLNHKGITRYIVFDVSGVIHLQSEIVLSKSSSYVGNYTVNGFSAPKGGITILGYPIVQVELRNFIWRGVRFRNGYKDEDGGWSNHTELQNRESQNFIIDRCSFAYARSKGTGGGSADPGVEITGGITIQNNLFGESQQAIISGNSNAANASPVSVLRNVMSNVGWRHPKIGGEVSIDVINNFSHNWRNRLIRTDAHDFKLNLIGNYYQAGTDTTQSDNPEILFTSWTNSTMSPQIWDEDNYIDPEFRPTNYPAQPWSAWDPFYTSTAPIKQEWFASSRLSFQGRSPSILPSANLKSAILPKVGASEYIDNNGNVQFYRDTTDMALINLANNDSNSSVLDSSQYESLALGLISTTHSEARPANFYQANPHIPQVWFQANVPAGQNHNDIAPSGYTWLEEYLNQVDL